MSTLSLFLSSCGGKLTSKSSEWLFDCWLCGGKEKLYFNINKMVGYCQKCSTPVSLKQLASELGGVSVKEIQQYIDEAAYKDRVGQDFKDTLVDILLSDDLSKRLAPPREIALPPTFRTLEDGESSVLGRKALAYLLGRGFKRELLFAHGFGYCSRGTYQNRIIVPFREQGKLVYWQARDFTGKVPLKDKIWNPSAASASIGKSSVLFNYDVAKTKPTVVICESWGSAMATGQAAVALNGKTMSNVQLDKLLQLPAMRFLVLLDHGAEDRAWEIAKRLASHRETLLALLPYGDPNEVERSVLFRSIKEAIPYSSSSHAQFTLNQLLHS